MSETQTPRRDNARVAAFLSGQAVSLFGSSLVQYALVWHIVLKTNSGWIMGLFTACSFAPQILISLFGGVLADRHNRKLLIMLADGGIALSTLALCILILTGDYGFAPMFVVSAIRSLGSGVQQPAVSAVLPQIVPEDKLMRVNSINGMIQSFVMLLSPAAAAGVYAAFSLPGILLIDVVTAAIGIGILAMIRIPTHQRGAGVGESHVFKELADGLRYAAQSTFIKRMTLYYVISSILIVPAAMFTALLVNRHYVADPSQQMPMEMMLNELMFFVGSLVGGGAMAAWGGFKNRIVTLAFGSVVFGLATAAMGLLPAFWLYLGLMLLAGLTMPAFQAPVMSLLQERIPMDMMGRIFSLMQIASNVIMMFATLVFGVMSDSLPLAVILLISGVLLALMGVAMISDKSFLKYGVPLAKPAEPQPDGPIPEA